MCTMSMTSIKNMLQYRDMHTHLHSLVPRLLAGDEATTCIHASQLREINPNGIHFAHTLVVH